MKNYRKIFSITFALLVFSSHASAQTYSTNVDGVILKNVKCTGNFISLNVSNRSNQNISGRLIATLFDSDGDPIDNGVTDIGVSPVSGDKVFMTVSCDSATKYTFRIE